MTFVIPGLPKLNPGLKLANTFGVTVFVVNSFLGQRAGRTLKLDRSGIIDMGISTDETLHL
jgi:hypothetical protein